MQQSLSMENSKRMDTMVLMSGCLRMRRSSLEDAWSTRTFVLYAHALVMHRIPSECNETESQDMKDRIVFECNTIQSIEKQEDVDGHAFVFMVQTRQESIWMEAESAISRSEWINSFTNAQQLCQLPFAREHTGQAFMRFASSDSEDSEEDDTDDNHIKTSIASRPFTQQRRAAATMAVPLHSSTIPTLAILQITVTNEYGETLMASIPMSPQSLNAITVRQIKLDAIQQLRKQIVHANRVHVEAIQRGQKDLFHDVVRKEADWFALYDRHEKLWIKDESQCIGAMLSHADAKSMVMELKPVSQMPFPSLLVRITSTKTRQSDLTQRSYTLYLIDMVFEDMKWQVPRRYKEFARLHDQLRTKYDERLWTLPKLPSKRIFTPVSGDFIDRRRQQLEQYLQSLLMHPTFGQDVMLLSFLGVVSMSRDREQSRHPEKNVVHVTSLHLCLDYGDIVLFSCRFGASVMQRKFTGSKYDHVGMVVPGPSKNLLRILEATGEGIQVYSLKARLMAYAREVSKTIVVRHVAADRTPETLERLSKFVQRVEGNSYSIFGILRARGESQKVDLGVTKTISPRRLSGRRLSLSDLSIVNALERSSSSSDASTSESVLPSSSATTDTADKRKYFCSSLVASALKHVGWLDTTRSSSYFWPGSFENGGDIEQYLTPGVRLGPETVIDCRIVEVGLATTDDKQPPTTG